MVREIVKDTFMLMKKSLPASRADLSAARKSTFFKRKIMMKDSDDIG